MTARSNKAEVRNPLLALPAFRRLAAELDDSARALLIEALAELKADCAERAELNWRRHKAPMAAYWKAASVYIGHIRRVLRIDERRPLDPGERLIIAAAHCDAAGLPDAAAGLREAAGRYNWSKPLGGAPTEVTSC